MIDYFLSIMPYQYLVYKEPGSEKSSSFEFNHSVSNEAIFFFFHGWNIISEDHEMYDTDLVLL